MASRKVVDLWFSGLSRTLSTRWAKGAREYGDRSFSEPARKLADEILEELADVIGWLFVLWHAQVVERLTHGRVGRRPRDRWQSQAWFLRDVAARLESGSLSATNATWRRPLAREAVSNEIVRLAAVAALRWWQTRNSLDRICAALAPQMPEGPLPIPEHNFRRRGGLTSL